jgi:DNA helicase MCM9
MLESLVRLAQAHAKLCFSNAVHVLDAVVAVQCVEMSMMTSALLDLDSVPN